jgi:hypothetical protein
MYDCATPVSRIADPGVQGAPFIDMHARTGDQSRGFRTAVERRPSLANFMPAVFRAVRPTVIPSLVIMYPLRK